MAVIDKHQVLTRLDTLQPVILELGCGNRKRLPNSLGIDMLDYEAVDIVGDVFEVLRAFQDESVNGVSSHHFVEHVADLGGLMAELARILKPGGSLEFVAPHFSNPYFYSDYTHRSFFGLYTFCYFTANPYFKRAVPNYQQDLRFALASVDIIFKSPPPFYVRYGLKKAFGFIFNLNNYTREFYEENLCYLFPCYEVKYQLKKIK